MYTSESSNTSLSRTYDDADMKAAQSHEFSDRDGVLAMMLAGSDGEDGDSAGDYWEEEGSEDRSWYLFGNEGYKSSEDVKELQLSLSPNHHSSGERAHRQLHFLHMIPNS